MKFFRRYNYLSTVLKIYSQISKNLTRKIILFSLLYLFIAGFFFAYLSILQYFTILRDAPAKTGLQSIMRLQPGLSFVPNKSFKHTLIYVRTTEPLSFSSLTDQMTAFLQQYLQHSVGGKRTECSNDTPYINFRRTCIFDISAGGPCTVQDGYGYHRGEPCIIIKLNRIYGWVPDPVSKYDTGVAVRCKGMTDLDNDLLGDICYYDFRWFREINKNTTRQILRSKELCRTTNGTFDSMFYPYLSQQQYHSPLVFVRFPNVKRYVVIRVVCYAIAKNIIVDYKERSGSVSFELLID